MATIIKKSDGNRGPSAGAEEWHALRLFDSSRSRPVVFGATVAAAAVGVSKYRSALDVYCEQRGLVEPMEPTPTMLWGIRHEPTVLKAYEDHLTEKGVNFNTLKSLPFFFHRPG